MSGTERFVSWLAIALSLAASGMSFVAATANPSEWVPWAVIGVLWLGTAFLRALTHWRAQA